MRVLLYLSIVVFLQSCTENNNNVPKTEVESNQVQEQVIELEEEIEIPTFEFTDSSLIVNNTSVIFLYPDSTENREMEEEYSEEDLTEILSGMHWYPMLVQEELDSTQFSYTDCNKQTIVFHGNGNGNGNLILNKKELEGNMIIFNVSEQPIVTYAVNFDKQVHLEFLGK